MTAVLPAPTALSLGGARRVTWLEATEGRDALAGLWGLLRSYLDHIAGDRATVTLRHLPTAAPGARHPAARLLSDAVALGQAQQAAAGADVLVYGCWAAPVAEARALVDVPVTGLTEASVRLGATLAARPAVVTVSEGLRHGLERDFAALGAPDLPLWWLEPASSHDDVLVAVDEPAALIDRFDRVARRAADAGADAILVGCGYLGPLFTVHGYRHVGGRPDVGVLDCCLLAFEFANLLADLAVRGVRPSRRSAPPLGPGPGKVASDLLARLTGDGS